MVEFWDTLLRKLWLFIVCMLIFANLFLLFARGAISTSTSSTAGLTDISFNPNAVDRSMAMAANDIDHATALAGYVIGSGARSVASAATLSVVFVGRTVKNSVAFVGRNVIGSVAFMIHSTGHIAGLAVSLVSKTTDMDTLIRPADKSPVPVISSLNLPTVTPAVKTVSQTTSQAAKPTVQTASQTTPQTDSAVAQWPIHGAITTLFGVPEMPYERIHTGLDISDGKAPGITPIKPFKPGRVIDVERSNLGLGNHIIVDNGGGVTSVYGHLYSISVQLGQLVDENTVLGHEGSTGASTGTHLHFEIRINGQPVNPLLYVSGRP